jgi:alkylation response protein AidB-like acyl-CoA dehydrogenase
VRFAFTEDQRELAAAVRDILDSELDAAAREPSARRAGVWKHLADAGVFGLLVPEEQGGLGMTELDAVLLLEELGRAAVPGLVAETAFVAAPVIAVGDPDRAAALAAGELAVSVQMSPGGFLPDADIADVLLLPDGQGARLVNRSDATLTTQPTIDPTRPLASLSDAAGDLAGLRVDAAPALAERAVLATAAQLTGAARHLLDATVSYAMTREQFGKQIGSFQAIKHQLADMLLAIEFARPMVHRAAYSLTHRLPTATRDVSAAKVSAATAGLQAVRTALQVHGAIGYTEELDTQVWFKRTWWLVAAWGDADRHRRLVASALAGGDLTRTP